MSENKKTTAAIYVRVSTEEQAAEGQSISAQIETLKDYCRLFHIDVYQVYQDLGISGKDTRNRPGLNALMSDASRGLFNLVLVWKISRLSRSLKDLLYIIDTFEKNGVAFSSYSEKFDTSTPVGRMTLQLLGSIAEFERNTIVENVKLGLREYARKGGRTGAVLGYDSVGKKLAVNEKEAETVRLIYELYAEKKMGLSAIAHSLNKQGLRTKRGCIFSGSSIATILDNPVYIGLNRHQCHTDCEYTVPGSHPPIVDRTLWEKARKRRGNGQNSNKAVKQPRSETALLTGLLRCPDCGAPMHIFYSVSKGKSYRYYKCSSKTTSRRCKSGLLNADAAEGKALDCVLQILQNPIIIKDITNNIKIKWEKEKKGSDKALKGVESEIAKQNQALRKYYTVFEENEAVDDIVLLERISEIKTQLKVLEAKRQELTALQSEPLPAEDLSLCATELSALLQWCETKDIRELLGALFKYIKFDDHKNISDMALRFPLTINPTESKSR